MRISTKKMVEKVPEYTDKCPRCGHWAQEHQRDLPRMYTVVQEANADRVCTHAVAVKGEDGVFRPCGCTLIFRDKLDAYKKLRVHGVKIDSIVGLLHIPRQELTRYVASRLNVSPALTKLMPKPALMHLEETEPLEEQKHIGGDTQIHLFEQVITLIEKEWVDLENTKVFSAVGYLKRLLKHIDTKNAEPWGEEETT